MPLHDSVRKNNTPLTLISVIFLLTLVSGSAQGQKRWQPVQQTEKNYIGFHFDDDFLFLGNRDEQYTGGLEFEYIRKQENKPRKKNWLHLYPQGESFLHFTQGSLLFTPYNVSDSTIILNDRPFSSYIYFSGGKTNYSQRRDIRRTWEVYLGIMGSALPGKVQDALHTIGDSPPASGWDNRVMQKETFIPNLKYHVQKNWFSLSDIRRTRMNYLQVSTLTEFNAGLYLNSVKAGGRITGFNHNPDMGSRYSLKGKGKRENLKKWHWDIYFMPQLQFILHNTNLQGLPWIDSPYTISTDVLNRFVWQIDSGINLRRGRLSLSYVLRAMTQEFNKYNRSWHSWAGVSVGFAF